MPPLSSGRCPPLPEVADKVRQPAALRSEERRGMLHVISHAELGHPGDCLPFQSLHVLGQDGQQGGDHGLAGRAGVVGQRRDSGKRFIDGGTRDLRSSPNRRLDRRPRLQSAVGRVFGYDGADALLKLIAGLREKALKTGNGALARRFSAEHLSPLDGYDNFCDHI